MTNAFSASRMRSMLVAGRAVADELAIIES